MNYFVIACLILSSTGTLCNELPPNNLPVIGTINFRLDQATPKQREDLKVAIGADIYSKMENNKKAGAGATLSKDSKIGDSKVSDVSLLVKNMREGICLSLKKGDEFKFSMAWDASAKVWGVGVGANTGIEVTVRCL